MTYLLINYTIAAVFQFDILNDFMVMAASLMLFKEESGHQFQELIISGGAKCAEL